MEDPVYKEELLRLVAEKKIKHTAKYIKNATDETLKKSTTNTNSDCECSDSWPKDP